MALLPQLNPLPGKLDFFTISDPTAINHISPYSRRTQLHSAPGLGRVHSKLREISAPQTLKSDDPRVPPARAAQANHHPDSSRLISFEYIDHVVLLDFACGEPCGCSGHAWSWDTEVGGHSDPACPLPRRSPGSWLGTVTACHIVSSPLDRCAKSPHVSSWTAPGLSRDTHRPPSAAPQRGGWRVRRRSQALHGCTRRDARVGGLAGESVRIGLRM